MIIKTKHFGEVDIDEHGIIFFKEGLPGFEEIKKFVVLKGDTNSPFSWLQNIEDVHPAFAIISPFEIKKDYEIDIDEDTIKMLEIKDAKDVLVYTIVVIPEDLTKISTNLKAPLIINLSNNKARQMVMDNSEYQIKFFILDELLKNIDNDGQEAK